MRNGMKTLAFVSSVGLLSTLAPTLSATMVRRLNLQEMTRSAQSIFLGKVTDVRQVRDDYGFPASIVTFDVLQAIKGNMGQTVQIKQVGNTRGGRPLIPGLPRYRAGEEVILFLRRPSAGGFTSPVGLGQGKFTVIRRGRETLVTNELANANLQGRAQSYWNAYLGLQGATLPQRPGPMPLDQFLHAVQLLVRSP